jgi:hypothetical protein
MNSLKSNTPPIHSSFDSSHGSTKMFSVIKGEV